MPLARLNITMAANETRLLARNDLLVNGGGSTTRWNASGITHRTPGSYTEYSASRRRTAPHSELLPAAVSPAPTVCRQCLEITQRSAAPLSLRQTAETAFSAISPVNDSWHEEAPAPVRALDYRITLKSGGNHILTRAAALI